MDSINYIRWAAKQRIAELLKWLKYCPDSIFTPRRSDEVARLQKLEQDETST